MATAPAEGDSSISDIELKGNISASSDWDQDRRNPCNWTPQRKWTVTGFSCFLSLMIGLNSLAINSAATFTNATFGVSDEHFPNSYWAVTAWNLGAMLGPVLGLPLMENFGIRIIYFISYTIFVIFIIPQALAQTYVTLVVTRFFAGVFGSIGQNAVANVIGDLFVGVENTLANVFFLWAYLTGFTLGPVFGSAVVQFLNWRWIFYVQLIMYGILIPFVWILIRETRGTIIRSKRRFSTSAQDDGKPSVTALLYDGTVRPLRLFSTEPVLFAFVVWVSLAISNVFLASQSIAQTYGANYGFDNIQAGYVQGSMVVGMLIGLGFSLLQCRLYYKSITKDVGTPGEPCPEAILTLAGPLSLFGTAGGIFIYAWTNYSDIPWIAPTIGLALTGVGIQVVTHSGVAYITDCYGIYSGSAVAAFAFIENLCSAFLPLSAKSMYSTLGFPWASSLLGFFALFLSAAPIVLYFKGPQIRARSKFMSNL